jgi:hypothetical protein
MGSGSCRCCGCQRQPICSASPIPVLVDAEAGNKAKLTKALNAWYANAHQIASFLSQANPQSGRSR